MENLVERIKALYEQLDEQQCTKERLAEVYAENIHFQDPFHQLKGLGMLTDYMQSMYQGVTACQFVFDEQFVGNDYATLAWRMNLVHPKLKRGKQIEVEGISLLRGTDRIDYHRDYFDGGQLLYENIPLMGGLISMLKKRMAQEN